MKHYIVVNQAFLGSSPAGAGPHKITWQQFSRSVGRGGPVRAAAPPPKKKEKRERGEEERKKEEREKRNQKRKEIEPVIVRTCGHGPLVAPRQPSSPETPDRNGVGISPRVSAPPSAKSCLPPWPRGCSSLSPPCLRP